MDIYKGFCDGPTELNLSNGANLGKWDYTKGWIDTTERAHCAQADTGISKPASFIPKSMLQSRAETLPS